MRHFIGDKNVTVYDKATFFVIFNETYVTEKRFLSFD